MFIMFILSDIFIYIYLAFLSVLNIIAPLSGSAMITPVLAILTDPHKAIGLASFYFLLSGIVRICIFWRHIQWHELKILLPTSLFAAFWGTLALIAINETLLLLIILLFAIYFFLKKIKITPYRDRRNI